MKGPGGGRCRVVVRMRHMIETEWNMRSDSKFKMMFTGTSHTKKREKFEPQQTQNLDRLIGIRVLSRFDHCKSKHPQPLPVGVKIDEV
jgi:hypothetical protein